jgi:hypothetical protein
MKHSRGERQFFPQGDGAIGEIANMNGPRALGVGL